MTFKMINDKGDDDDQDSIKKDNEQLKMQIMKISNDYKELQKKYNILNDKYLLKNENKNMLNISNYTNSITTISNNDIEKVKENSLEGLVKKLLLTIQVNQKNRTYVIELCKLVGFDLETTNKILNNKNKNSLLCLFPK